MCLLYYNDNMESKEIIQHIHKEGIAKLFTYKNVSKVSVIDLVKNGIRHVPTIIIIGDNKHKQIFEGSQALFWVKNLIENRKKNMSSAPNKPLIKQNVANFISPYSSEEMSGTTDLYAYIKTDDPQQKAYMPFGKEENYRILTIAESKEKMSQEDQEQLLKKIQNAREIEGEQIKLSMENNIRKIINNAESHNFF